MFVSRMLSSIEYGRPLGVGWQGSLGLNIQRATCVDDQNNPILHDIYGGPVIINRGSHGHDIMALGTIRVAYSYVVQVLVLCLCMYIEPNSVLTLLYTL